MRTPPSPLFHAKERSHLVSWLNGVLAGMVTTKYSYMISSMQVFHYFKGSKLSLELHVAPSVDQSLQDSPGHSEGSLVKKIVCSSSIDHLYL